LRAYDYRVQGTEVGAKPVASVLQLKLTLLGTKPPTWRRLRVPGKISLRELHEVIQALAGWAGTRPHEFAIAEKRYGLPAPHEMVPVFDEGLYRLHSLRLTAGTVFTYVYDFSDRWEIEAKVEEVIAEAPGDAHPYVLEGARAFPLEGSGGVSGYRSLLAVLSDPSHPEYEESRRRAGESFDPESFDPRETNAKLRSMW
jgi:Plasmid pRiA4b ORF-3-like protein